MDDIREHRKQIYKEVSSFLNGISNIFVKPVKYDLSIWTKDDLESPVGNKNCIDIRIYWE